MMPAGRDGLGRFEFASAGRIIFGRGRSSELPELAARLGARALLVAGPSALSPRQGMEQPAGARLEKALASAGLAVARFLVRSEPTTRLVDEGARLALAAGCDVVIGLGGGSVLDAAKAIAGLITNGGEALDYLEVVGLGRPLTNPAAPLIAVPTTAGTGSEVTKNAVLAEPSAGVKASMRSAHLLPAVALVDPDLTVALPPALTASTGLDALTQLIEGYLCLRANPLTDALALEGIARSARSLLRAVREGSDAAAREDLALASLLGGLVLANSGLGAVHGIAAPLGGRHPVPHGVACARLLPHIFRANLASLQRTAGPGARRSLDRMDRVGSLLLANLRDENQAPFPGGPGGGADLLDRLVAACPLPGLGAFGVTAEECPSIAEAALRSSSMKGNPAPLTPKELAAAIEAALTPAPPPC